MSNLIFRPEHIQMIREGKKWQTRRPVKEGEKLAEGVFCDTVYTASGIIKWKEGRTYAIRPGRTAKGIARVRIAGLWREWLKDINDFQINAEGYKSREEFLGIWEEIYGKVDLDKARVWVIDFEYVGEIVREEQ